MTSLTTRRPKNLVRLLLALLPVLLLAACASHYAGSGTAGLQYAPGQYFPPPGPPSDPWGPYIRQAAARYHIPGQWIRAFMHQESDGKEQAISPVGAIGLMQVMPSTYASLGGASLAMAPRGNQRPALLGPCGAPTSWRVI
jgi:membrane-bound lytic murein transglycosylase B